MNKNQKSVLILGGVIVSALVILFVSISFNWGWQGHGEGYNMMGPGMMGGFGAMLFMPVIGIIILGLVIWAVLSAFHKPGDSNDINHLDGSSHKEDSPIDILKKRYARGEIEKEEYEAKKKDLV